MLLPPHENRTGVAIGFQKEQERESPPTNKKPPMKTRIRAAVATALVVALSLALSGCLMIPLLDDRSPFDDPFGATNAQIRKALPLLQETLDQVDVGPDYKLVAGRKSDECEGDCYLRLLVRIEAAEHLVASEAERPAQPCNSSSPAVPGGALALLVELAPVVVFVLLVGRPAHLLFVLRHAKVPADYQPAHWNPHSLGLFHFQFLPFFG